MTDNSILNWHDLHALVVKLTEERDALLKQLADHQAQERKLRLHRGVIAATTKSSRRPLEALPLWKLQQALAATVAFAGPHCRSAQSLRDAIARKRVAARHALRARKR